MRLSRGNPTWKEQCQTSSLNLSMEPVVSLGAECARLLLPFVKPVKAALWASQRAFDAQQTNPHVRTLGLFQDLKGSSHLPGLSLMPT